MAKEVDYYAQKFSPRSKAINPIGLNVSTSAGIAPNKPVLLLAIIELIARGDIQHNRIDLSPELIAAFLKLWKELEIDRHADIGMPFFHLHSDGFWHFKANPGYEFLENKSSKIKFRTVSALQQAVNYAYLDVELFSLLQIPESRHQLTLTIVNSWFSDKMQHVQESMELNAFAELQASLLESGGKVYRPEEVEREDEQQSIVRDSAFRRIITSIYDYRCAFCGLRTMNGLETIVDGAHIKPFSQFFDARIDNGLSLCKNHHWAFDRFWFSIDEDYQIVLSRNLRENSPNARPMQEFIGHRLLLPSKEKYYPRLDALQWHRQVFWEKQSIEAS